MPTMDRRTWVKFVLGSAAAWLALPKVDAVAHATPARVESATGTRLELARDRALNVPGGAAHFERIAFQGGELTWKEGGTVRIDKVVGR